MNGGRLVSLLGIFAQMDPQEAELKGMMVPKLMRTGGKPV
jgi:hypothetical protein